jgi:hypothetical protein
MEPVQGQLFIPKHPFRLMAAGGDDTIYLQYLYQLIEGEKHSDGKGMPYGKMDSDQRVT